MPADIVSFILPALVIGIIGLLVGAVAGYLIGGMQEPEPQEPKRPANLAETARLWRDKRSGRLAVEMDGKIVAAQTDLTARQREMLQKTAGELRLWLGDLDARPPQKPPAPAAAPPAAAQKPPAAPIPPTLKVSPAPGAPLPSPISSQPEVAPVPVDLTTALTGRSAAEKARDSLQRSIASQVEEIVQERLLTSPFRERNIHVQDSLRYGIEVVVDTQVFNGVGEVSDPAIQKFLRDCVAEWERRSGQ